MTNVRQHIPPHGETTKAERRVTSPSSDSQQHHKVEETTAQLSPNGNNVWLLFAIDEVNTRGLNTFSVGGAAPANRQCAGSWKKMEAKLYLQAWVEQKILLTLCATVREAEERRGAMCNSSAF